VNKKLWAHGLIASVMAGVLLTHSAQAAGTQAQAAQSSAMTVNVEKAQTLQWTETVGASGWLAAWQEAIVAAETGAFKITEVNVDIGSSVKAGDILVKLDPASATASVQKQEAQVASARASLAKAHADAMRAKEVGTSGALSGQDINGYMITEQTAQAALDSAQAALVSERLSLQQTDVRAPDDGIVSSRSADLGKVVSAGTELLRLIRQGRVEWQAEVASQDLPRIGPGMKATLRDGSGRQFEGSVRLVSPIVNTGTSRGIVYVQLPKDPDIRVGLYGTGSIVIDTKPAMTVSESALVFRDGINYVFTVGDDYVAVRKRVEVGRRRDNRVEILSGITANDRIVSSGGAFLSENAVVRVREDSK